MKKCEEIKSVLGLTQEEMAQVLGITKSQWSMYKSGLRDIPLEAKIQLGLLLKGTQDKQLLHQYQIVRKNELTQMLYKLKKDIAKVQFKLLCLDKEIKIVENQRSEIFAALKTASYLELRKEQSALAETIKVRVMKALVKNDLYKIEQLKLKKENLILILQSINQRLQKATFD